MSSATSTSIGTSSSLNPVPQAVKTPKTKPILVIDFGSQTAHLIGRRLRDLGVQCAYTTPEEALEQIQQQSPQGIIFSGGPDSVYQPNAPTVDLKIYKIGIPILGICYGWQLMAHQLGGRVQSASKEYGPEHIDFYDNFFDLPKISCKVIMSHGDSVTSLPEGFSPIGETNRVLFAAVKNEAHQLFGLQFHPEADHTEQGSEMLRYFAEKICKLEMNPLVLNTEKLIGKIKAQVGDQHVVCGVSGGVDSTVAAFLIAKAIGHRLHPVYIESGLMRKGTVDTVRMIFTELVQADLTVVDAKTQFMEVLAGLTDPEEKRKAIGKLFYDLFQQHADRHPEIQFLAQGTIFSDVIESKGSKHASKIKSHHNVGGLPSGMQLKLLEPLRKFYKDEVRKIGRSAGLPPHIVGMHPFPGPGYAIRVRGEVTEKRLEQVKQADEIIMEELIMANLYDRIFQCFAIMTGAYSTAVKGDERVFAEVVAIRAYESNDVMTAGIAQLPWEILGKMVSRIVNEVPDISRVVYDVTPKPPATMEWE